MRSLQLGRDGARLDKIWLEVLTGVDGQGKPSYDAPVLVRGRVVPSETVTTSMAGAMADQQVQIIATMWLDAKQAPLPRFQDRVTSGDLKGIVIERTDGKALSGRLDHVRCKIREE